MATSTARVLVVEDDAAVRDALTVALEQQSFDVRATSDGLAIEQTVRDFRPDLAVLDVRLPVGPSGLGVARTIRMLTDAPIIFLTAADEVEDRLAGFRAGGDDYLAKPFSVEELLARIRALLRRSGRLAARWQVADVVVDEDARTVTRGAERLELTRTEFDLLVALGSKPGRVLSKNQLLAAVWGFEEYDPNLVEVYISTLRRKLEEHGPRLINTVRGVGYVLQP